MKINSPFVPYSECLIVKEISTKEIIDAYHRVYKIEVGPIFKGLERIYVCRCPNTSFEFYYPFGLDGDENFYNKLSQKDWYYQKSRWEHQVIIDLIKDNDTVLEIGSGSGAFIKQLIDKKPVSYCGLELNNSAINIAAKDKIVLTNQLLGDHVSNKAGQYDVVCSFQVFEHVSKIAEFFSDSLKALRSGGLLIISVPNNDANFIKNNQSDSKYLNMPPHHTNLFNELSLERIARCYDMRLKTSLNEPLQEMHLDVFIYNKVLTFFMGSTFLLRAFWKLKLHMLLRPVVRFLRNKIKGHTIIAIYEKK